MIKLLSILSFLIVNIHAVADKYKEIIYNDLNLLDAHIRVCLYDDEICSYSAKLIKDFSKYINRMYYSIVKHESGNFRYRRGLYDKYDYGLPQINVRYWTKNKLEKFGYTNILDIKQLIYDDKLALDVGFTVLWYNICYAYANGVRYRTILEYVSTYHSPMKKNHYYIQKVKYIYYNH